MVILFYLYDLADVRFYSFNLIDHFSVIGQIDLTFEAYRGFFISQC